MSARVGVGTRALEELIQNVGLLLVLLNVQFVIYMNFFMFGVILGY